MTNRQTFHDDMKSREDPQTSRLSGFKERDSYCYPADHNTIPDAAGRRISRRQLEDILLSLSDRDKAILTSLQSCRYLTTEQIQRLHFIEASTRSAALRAASRNLNKLKNSGLIDNLDRRIGGVRAGSASFVWRLSTAGQHLLRLTDSRIYAHKKPFEPSPHFLAHTLASAECFIRLSEIGRDQGMKLTELQMEPDCWRPYNSAGKIVSLKPDLFAVTVCGNYEDRWFFEIDLDTESPVRIIEKCNRYHKYYQSGLEQKQYGVFPLVVWIVPDVKRKLALEEHIGAEFSKLPNIFTVITSEELEPLIQQGLEGITL